MPRQAWSSFTGSWRLVEIKKTAKAGLPGAVNALVTGLIIGAVDFLIATFAGFDSWELLVAAVAAAFAAAGAVNVVRISAIPSRLTFDGQVIARWQVNNGSDGITQYFAVDDGEKGWVFIGDVTLEDVLRITVNPRNGGLIDFAVVARQRPETPVEVTQPAAPLLTNAEVAELIGPVSRTTPLPSLAGSGIVYRGRDGTLTLAVNRGAWPALGKMLSSKAGSPLPGVGDEAWLLSKDSGVAVRVGDQIAMLKVTGQATERPPDLLAQVARTVAARLSGQLTLPNPPTTAVPPGATLPATQTW